VKGAAVVVAVLAFYGFFYRHVVARWGPAAQWAARRLQLDVRHPVREVDATGKLATASVAQLFFAIALAWALGLGFGDLVGPGLRPEILVAAAALGVGELALTSLVCTVVVELAVLAAAGSRAAGVRDWAAKSRGGWMSYFLLTARAAPSALAVLSICMYVVVEELIFRGILLTALAGWDRSVAVVLSTALFVAVQAFAMPSGRAATFPMVGAFVVGIVHAVIFLHVPDVLPLAVAHLAFFGAALSTARAPIARTV
jgi:hypothetical protein